MNLNLSLIILILLLTNCKNVTTSDKSALQTQEVDAYDTIKIDLDATKLLADKRNERWKKMETTEIIDSLLALAARNEIQVIEDSELLFGNFKEMGKFYTNNIPSSIYTILFPQEEITIDRRKISRTKVDEVNKKVIFTEGYEVREERKYKYLYAVIEKEKFLLMLFTKQGKFSPELELVTVSKDDLKAIDNLPLFGGIYDSYDINYWTSEFMKDHSQVRVTKVENMEFTKVKLDTIETNYKISPSGKISI